MKLGSILEGLKEKQLSAVKHTTGPLLILAGAGTGKTTTITAKIAYMVKELGIDPAHILALTFSREAATNMKVKVEQLLGGVSEVQVSTFHSFCAQIIRENADKCGVPSEFAILEDVDTAIILHKDLGAPVRDALLYANSISKAKDLNITIDTLKEFLGGKKQVLLDMEGDEESWEKTYHRNTTRLNTFHLLDNTEKKGLKSERRAWIEFNDVYTEYVRYRDLIGTWVKYEKRKKRRGVLDYGDLNKKALEFLNTYGAQHVTDRYRYIIIDEFQDTNYVQFELIKLLSGDERNVTVVADPNQTIYAFRGAYTNNIQEFTKYFNILPGDIVSLDVSFRSTDRILRVSHDLIKGNYSAIDMDMCIQLHNYAGVEGENVHIVETTDDNEEARYVVEQIEKCLERGMNPSEIAVLYRTHAQGRKVKQALENRGHSIRVKDDTDFLKQPEIKTALAYLYVLDTIGHPKARGTESWWRLFHHNHTLGTADSILIGEYLKKHRVSFQEAIFHHLGRLDLSPQGLRAVKQMKQRIGSLKEKLVLDVSDIVLEVLDASGLSRQFTHENTRRNKEAMMNLRNLFEMAVKFEKSHGRDLGEFIAYLEILDEMGKNPPAARISDEEAVNLMSIHSSKGLEFKAVFVISMAKDRFPLFRGGVEPLIPIELMGHYQDVLEQDFATENKRTNAIRERKREIKLEEERRLCYVAMTRAKEYLVLTLAEQYDGRVRRPSEFLMDMGYDNWRAPDTPVLDVPDITYLHDTDVRSEEIIRHSELERMKVQRKKLILETLDSGSFEESLEHLLTYHALRDGNETDYLEVINSKWDELDPKVQVNDILIRDHTSEGMPHPSDITFSVTSINTYSKCPKMYELQQVLGMPTRAEEQSDGAMNVGSFVHRVLEMAVRQKISTREQLDGIVASLTELDRWKWVDIDRARPLLDVFWERHKDTIPNNLMVEKMFSVKLVDHIFTGFIDRVDLIAGTDNEVEIIDYKTGKEPGPVERSRQLLLYARGFNELRPEYQVQKLTLELLSQEKPRVYELQDGEYVSSRVKPLDSEVIPEMVETAERIIHDYRYGFETRDDDKQCKKCGYRLYCGA
ncbi:MAG: ATP-dependent helicase [ANME-2 cluster archaeon]|nr:ATP-dependent helicase [ANME-2 cluster archaeon]